MAEEKQNQEEQEVGSNDTQNQEGVEETSTENEEQGTSEENPEELKKKIKELEGTKNYYQSQYKKLKDKKPEQEDKSGDVPTREEVFLVSKGYSEEDLNQMNVIAKGKGISLKETEEDPLFKAYKSNVEQEDKSQKAQVGASTGSKMENTGNTKEDHKKKHGELLKKYQG